MSATIIGVIAIGLPALVVAWICLWKRVRPVFWFAMALIVLGLGYLVATGAAGDIGRKIAPSLVASSPLPAPAR